MSSDPQSMRWCLIWSPIISGTSYCPVKKIAKRPRVTKGIWNIFARRGRFYAFKSYTPLYHNMKTACKTTAWQDLNLLYLLSYPISNLNFQIESQIYLPLSWLSFQIESQIYLPLNCKQFIHLMTITSQFNILPICLLWIANYLLWSLTNARFSIINNHIKGIFCNMWLQRWSQNL